MELTDLPTHVYIDTSNIRGACLRSLGFSIDFIKLYQYLATKYPHLQEVRYYEGISVGDKKKLNHFRFLEEQVGYRVCSLERKGYYDPAKYKDYDCANCGYTNKIQILPKTIKLKSNIDVYLASDLLELVAKTHDPVHLVILSCDGDYAEAIRAALRINPALRITVLATPMTKQNNCLSIRLKALSRELPRDQYKLANIDNIRNIIAQLPNTQNHH